MLNIFAISSVTISSLPPSCTPANCVAIASFTAGVESAKSCAYLPNDSFNASAFFETSSLFKLASMVTLIPICV